METEPTLDSHLLFVTIRLRDEHPVLCWRCRQTGEPVFVHDYHDEMVSDFTHEEHQALKSAIRDSRIDSQYHKVRELAERWDCSEEARKARDLRNTAIEEIASIIAENRHRSDLSLARMIVERDYQP